MFRVFNLGAVVVAAVDPIRRGRLHRPIARRQELRIRHDLPEQRGNDRGGARTSPGPPPHTIPKRRDTPADAFDGR